MSDTEKNLTTTPQGRHMRQKVEKSQKYRWLALSVVGILFFALAVGGVSLLRLRGNVHTDALNIGDLTANGKLADGALDILVIGSDTRAGADAKYGTLADQQSGARSDVMMLVQVSADRKNVSVVSFPRDLMVTIPKCTDANTGVVYPSTTDTQINESLSRGGPGCTVATISSLTGVNIDHFMLVDFNAVKELSKVVGGVEVCVTKAIDDPYSGLLLPAGTSKVEGEQALAFLRSRHGFGDGSDTGRIQAQQGFLAALLRKVKSEGTLSNPTQLMNIAEAITQNVTVDSGLTNLGTLINIGTIFSNVNLSKVVFATVPHDPYVYDSNKLQLADSAQQLFQTLQNDQSLTSPTAAPSVAASPAEVATTQTVDRSVPVEVMNAASNSSVADKVKSDIAGLGYSQVTMAQNSGEYTQSMIYYPYGEVAQAKEIATKLGIQTVLASETITKVTVFAGNDLNSAGQATASPPQQIAGGASGQTADQATCQVSFGG